MKQSNLVEEELTYNIIGVLYKVHNKLGPLHQEKIYQRAIQNELVKQEIKHERESPVNIEYEYHKIGEYKLDFVIDDKVVLEIKATTKKPTKFVDQTLRYMNQLQIKVGLIANFTNKKLWIKRLLLPDKYIKVKSG